MYIIEFPYYTILATHSLRITYVKKGSIMAEDGKPARKKHGSEEQAPRHQTKETPPKTSRRDYRLGKRYRSQAEIDKAKEKAKEIRDKTNQSAEPGRHKKRRSE